MATTGASTTEGSSSPMKEETFKPIEPTQVLKDIQCYEDYNIVQRLGLSAHSESMVDLKPF